MKNKPQEEKQKEEKAEASVFGSNADVKMTRDYSLGQLFKSRRKYYLLCLSLLSISAVCLGVTYGLRDTRSFDDNIYSVFKVTDLSKQFNMTDSEVASDGSVDNDYYLYYYSTTCSACESINPIILNYIESIASFSDPELLYFAEINSLYDTSSFSSVGSYTPQQYKEHLLGVSKTEDMIKVFENTSYTPTLFQIRDGAIKNTFVGTDEIVAELDFKDYSQYNYFDTASGQLQQSSQVYYIYYYDSNHASRDFKKTILDFMDNTNTSLYFANAELLDVISDNFDVSQIIGTTNYEDIKIPYAPYMLKIDTRSVASFYSDTASISLELGIE